FTNFRLAVENAHANSVEAAHDELKSKLRRGALMGAGASAVISAVFTGIHAMNAPHAEHDSVSQPEANAATSHEEGGIIGGQLGSHDAPDTHGPAPVPDSHTQPE